MTKTKTFSALLKTGVCAFLLFALAFLLFALAFLSLRASVSWAEEERRTFLWSDDAANIGNFEKLCEDRGVTSADVFRVNGCAPLPSAGDTLLIPSAKSDLNAVWMEVQTRKNGSASPLVSIKLHSVPRKLRVSRDAFPALLRPESPSPVDAKPALTTVPPPEAQKPAAMQAPPPGKTIIVKDDKMTWPVGGKITSGYGRRGKRRFHSGIDIPMPKGTPILAARDGVVLNVGTNRSKNYRGYGNTALIDHGNGIVTLYAHCQRVGVKKGQPVKRGDVIAFVGSTGRSTTNHLHFEVRKNGKAVNPLPYLISR
jgi:murein DD-endopeptidase MepM/ murein hydrolase activator NlpD